MLCLSFTAVGTVRQQPDPAGAADSPGQTPPSPATPAEKVPAETTQEPGKSALDAPAKAKTGAASANPGSARRVKKRRKRPTPPPPPPPDDGPRKIVVREGGAREPAAQIAPGMTPAEATRQRQNADQMLVYADGQLKLLTGRTLNARQQETVGQIRNYMEGARAALKEGDVRRANTLAEKAHMLADDLVKH